MLRAFFFVTFALAQLLCIGSAVAQPAVFWFNDPVGPDETVLVTGAELDTVTAATVSRVPDAGASAEPEVTKTVAILQPNAQSLKFVVPKGFAPGIYRFTLSHPQGAFSAEINLPTIYWTQGGLGGAVAPGGSLQIFGRNIVRRPDGARLILVPDGAGAPVTATLTEGGMWRAAFRVPDQIMPGMYGLRLSNGDGGDGEWVDAGHTQVRAVIPEPTLSLDVRAYGAVGDGKVNSTMAIAKALEAASRGGGGTVYFPRGRYLISDTLVIPPGVSIKGERTDLVSLVWSDFTDPPDALIKGTSRFSIEDLTINASNHGHIISGGFVGNAQAADASDIAIRRVRIRASAFLGHLSPEETYQRMASLHRRYPNAPDSIRLSGDRLVVSDCDIVGSGKSLYLFKASNVIISDNTLSNGRYGWISITGSSRVIFENNIVTSSDLQGTGGGINNLSSEVSASENVFMGRNTFKGFYGWDREAMTTDGPGGYYFGRAESAAPNRLSLRGALNEPLVSTNWVDAVVMVVDGRGAGQSARVAEFERGTASAQMSIALDRPLQVSLDATSMITVAQMQQNYLIVDNLFQDAGVAAQSFGTALNHVFAGNRSVRTQGFLVRAGIYFHFQPGWQIQLLDNRIIEGNWYQSEGDRKAFSGEAVIAVEGLQPDNKPDRSPLVRAVVVRGNRLEQDAHIEITGVSAASPGVRDVIVEANTLGASRVGLSVDRGVAWLLERRNAVNRIAR
jgi:parallel beta-helix repeat protein